MDPFPHVVDVAVVIPTYRRPAHLRQCLERLQQQTIHPAATVVVDSAPNEEATTIVSQFEGVQYARNPKGQGATATSRAIGIARTSESFIAFLDDDAYPRPDWLENLIAPYEDETVGAVGGRTLRGTQEENASAGPIGRLCSDGSLTGNFHVDPGRDVEVDHLLGANMSVRRSAVERIGGVRDLYPGTCLCEETDLTLRIQLAGYRVLFSPTAVVDHVAGPYARGQRFDLRWHFYDARNHTVLIASVFGARSSRFRAVLARLIRESVVECFQLVSATGNPVRRGVRHRTRGMLNGLVRAATRLAGLAVGLAVVARM